MRKLHFTAYVAAAMFCGAACGQGAFAGTIASTSFESPQFAAVPAGGVLYGPLGNAAYSNPASVLPAGAAGFAFNGYSGLLSNCVGACPYGPAPDSPTYYQVLPATPFGTQAAYLQTLSTNPSIDWTVGGLVIGAQYTLSFYDAGGTGPNVGVAQLDISFVGATALASTAFSPVSGVYTYNSLNFEANAASVTIGFNGGSSGANLLSGIDNVKISSVPEPLTLSLFGAGLAGAAALRRRKAKKA